MMKLERGVLVVIQAGKNKPPRIQVKIGDKLFNAAQGEVSQSVLDRLKEFNGKEVEFERVGGQPKKIREAGGEFVPPASIATAGTRSSGQASEQQAGGRFHNPYNFVPAPPRKTGDPELGDRAPVSQDRFHPGRYTGWIRVRLTAITPLLLPDPEKKQEEPNGHLTFATRVDAEGKPLIPASSVRGMLRSAYEAVTNSRFCRFSEAYKSRLAYRMEARQGLGMIPARISGGQIHLLTGTSKVGDGGRPDGPMYAAWLPRYRNGNLSPNALRYPDGALPEHGDEVFCNIERVPHRSGKFEYWAVREICLATEGDPPLDWVRGWVCVTNANINRKHDERVFFIANGGEILGPFPVEERHERQWKELIQDYRAIHKQDLEKRRKSGEPPERYLGPKPGRTAWSRHVYEKGYEELREGTLCYARLSADKKKVEALFPVMISRELYECSPWNLLDPSLRPAERVEELSPADRAWGWVRTESPEDSHDQRVAARGLICVGPVLCETENAVESFREPLPLAILSAPKPQQGRFYVAKNKQGDAQPDGLPKIQAGYSEGKSLRGRKVYPHHAGLPESHWQNPLEDRTQQGPPYQEYRRPRLDGKEQCDDQNRSVEGWVKAGAQFRFDLYVENLSQVELGALLWLLALPAGHCLRFGGGRPLGLGSVRLEITDCDLRTPEQLKSWYSAWVEQQQAIFNPAEAAIQAFMQAVTRAYGEPSKRFEQVPFIKAFLAACKGFGDRLPVHYPRVTAAPPPEGEFYKWFVENERQGRYALPDLVRDQGLLVLRERQSH